MEPQELVRKIEKLSNLIYSVDDFTDYEGTINPTMEEILDALNEYADKDGELSLGTKFRMNKIFQEYKEKKTGEPTDERLFEF